MLQPRQVDDVARLGHDFLGLEDKDYFFRAAHIEVDRTGEVHLALALVQTISISRPEYRSEKLCTRATDFTRSLSAFLEKSKQQYQTIVLD